MNKKEKDHNEGQLAGSKADFFDQAANVVSNALNPFHSDHYQKGFEHGVDSKLEKDPLSEFLFSSGKSKAEARQEEPASNVSQEDDDEDDYYFDDDDDYYSSYQTQATEPEPDPKPEPITITSVSDVKVEKTDTSFQYSYSVNTFTHAWETQEEKDKFLRQAALIKEMSGIDILAEDEDPARKKLAEIPDKLTSGGLHNIIDSVISIVGSKGKE
jgi:hypothetical protein